MILDMDMIGYYIAMEQIEQEQKEMRGVEVLIYIEQDIEE